MFYCYYATIIMMNKDLHTKTKTTPLSGPEMGDVWSMVGRICGKG